MPPSVEILEDVGTVHPEAEVLVQARELLLRLPRGFVSPVPIKVLVVKK